MTPPTNDIEILRTWVGREQVIVHPIEHGVVRRFELTLDRPPTLEPGDALPSMWHVAFFLEVAPTDRLGTDGHPERGGFLPPVALPRRMWAGSRIEFHEPIPIGSDAVKTSTIDDVVIKEGKSGTLCFVTVSHRTEVDGTLCIAEHQDLVYRDDPDPGAPRPTPKPAPTDAEVSETVEPSEVLLFRYSALTFNGHRIHYDRPYACEVEGYDGLVVHGPLTATLLADLAERTAGPLRTFSFRGTSPLLDTAPFTIHGRRGDEGMVLWATGPDGEMAMTATSTHA
jgi:3-methylfumaryl-CoA hydratase